MLVHPNKVPFIDFSHSACCACKVLYKIEPTLDTILMPYFKATWWRMGMVCSIWIIYDSHYCWWYYIYTRNLCSWPEKTVEWRKCCCVLDFFHFSWRYFRLRQSIFFSNLSFRALILLFFYWNGKIRKWQWFIKYMFWSGFLEQNPFFKLGSKKF